MRSKEDQEWWDNLVCRVCSVEKGIPRRSGWVAIGKCPECGEPHVLFRKAVQDDQ